MLHSIFTRRPFNAPVDTVRSSGRVNVQLKDFVNLKYVVAVMGWMKRCKGGLKRLQGTHLSDRDLLGNGCDSEAPALQKILGSRRRSINEDVASLIAFDSSQAQRVRQPDIKLFDAGYVERSGVLDQLLVQAMNTLRPGAFLVFKVPRIVKKNLLQLNRVMPLVQAGGTKDDRLGYSAQEIKSVVHRRGMELVSAELRAPSEQDMYFLIVARKPT